MPRNSKYNSLEKYLETKELARKYLVKKGIIFRPLKPKANAPYKLKLKYKANKAFKSLREPYKTIFKNTFIREKDLYWWSSQYSKSTFYRLRSKAIDDFLLAYQSR